MSLLELYLSHLFNFASVANVERESNDKAKGPVDEADVPESPVPDLPPRAPSGMVSAGVKKPFSIYKTRTWSLIHRRILSRQGDGCLKLFLMRNVSFPL